MQNTRVVMITGAAGNLGQAVADAFAALGDQLVLVGRRVPAGEADPRRWWVAADLLDAEQTVAAHGQAVQRFGRVDVLCHLAGGFRMGEAVHETSAANWDFLVGINERTLLNAARAVVPGMLERGGGYFLSTASAAGVLTILESAPYAVTKHGAVAFAEWLSVTHGGRGLRVSCLCPQAVATAMVSGDGGSAGGDGVLSPEAVADAVLQAMADERFFVFPHPQVEQYMAVKGSNHPHWLAGMRKAYARLTGTAPAAKP